MDDELGFGSNSKICKRKSDNEVDKESCSSDVKKMALDVSHSFGADSSIFGLHSPSFLNFDEDTSASEDQVFDVHNTLPCSALVDEHQIAISDRSQQWISTFENFSKPDRLEVINALLEVCDAKEIRYVFKLIRPFFLKDFISLLPKEIAIYILSMLSPKCLIRAAQTCRYWRNLTEDHLLWKEKCIEAGIPIGRNVFSTLRRHTSAADRQKCLYARSPYKSIYLHQRQVLLNWKKSEEPLNNMRTIKCHDEHVITCLQVAADLILTGSDDNTLRVWNMNQPTEPPQTLIGHAGGVWSSQLSKDGKVAISGSTDRTVRIWDTSDGECRFVLRSHTSTVRCMALHEKTLVTGSRDQTLCVWNTDDGVKLASLRGHNSAIRRVAFDGKIAVSGSYDHTLRVWDITNFQCLYELCGHTNRVYSLLYDSIGGRVISGSLDTSIRVWDVKTGKALHTLLGHRSLTSGMQLRGSTLVSGNADSTIKVWDIDSGRCLHSLEGYGKHQLAVTSLQYVSGDLVVTSSDDGTVKLWDVGTGDFIRDLVQLGSGGSGGCIWRLKATPTSLVCAVGSRNGTEDTKLIVIDFTADYP